MMVDERECDVEELATEDFVDGESIETAYFTISLVRIAKISMRPAPLQLPSVTLNTFSQ